MHIDIEFDFRTDANGRDPDSASPTLLRYHQILWSKPLPSGAIFDLRLEPGKYLIHESDLGVFELSSDTISNSMRSHKTMASLISQISSDELDAFQALGSTIGARLIFPGNKVDGQPTINVARGFSPRILDRIDWTLECIRSFYLGLSSPLSGVLQRYADFFGLYGDFEGYIEFFFLNDLADKDGVRRLISGQVDFERPRPASVETYREYMANSMAFVAARNRRIADWVARTGG